MFMLSKLSVDDLKSRISELEDAGSINSEMIFICNLLSEKLRYNNVNLRHSLSFANKAKNFAIKINYKEGQAYALAQIGHTLFHLDKCSEAEKSLHSSIRIFEELKNKRGLAFALNGLIWILIDFGKFREASEKIKQVFDIAVELGDDKEKIKVFDNMSKLCFFLKNYELPLEFHQKITSIKNSHLNYGRFYDHIGLLYFMKGKNSKSLQNFEKAIIESKKNNDTYAKACIYSNFAIVYYKLGEKEKANAHFQKSNILMKKVGLENAHSQTLENVINSNLQMKDYSNALSHIKKLLKLIQNGNNPYLRLKTQINNANTHLKLGKINEAYSILLKIKDEFADFKHFDLQFKFHRLFVQICEKKGDLPKALKHFHLYNKYRENYLSEKTSIFQTLFDIRNKVNNMKRDEEMLKEKNVEIAKAYDELANQNDAIHQTNSNNEELVNRIRRLKQLLPICEQCKEVLNKPNYLDELEKCFAEKPHKHKQKFDCLCCNKISEINLPLEVSLEV